MTITVDLGREATKKQTRACSLHTLVRFFILFSLQIGSVLGVVLLIGIVTMFSYVYPEVFEAKWNMWVGSVIVVIIPVTISFIAASIFCLPIASRKAILIETGVQNTGLCLALIAVSYDESLYVEIITFPILYSLFNVSLFLLLTLLYRVVMLLRKDGGVDEEKKPSNDKDEVKPTTNDEKFDKSTFGKSDAGDLELTRL